MVKGSAQAAADSAAANNTADREIVITRLIDDGTVINGSFRRMSIHTIEADNVIAKLSIASKLDADWEFLTSLRETGRERAEQWLNAHFDRLGVESTVDLQAVYM